MILPLTILFFLICAGPAGAAFCSRNIDYYPNGLANATGAVVATGRNSIEIFNEEQKRVEKFVYLEQGKPYHQGDYIRIYYHPQGAIVAAIKRMTVLEYKRNDQNLGYISH